MNIFFTVATSLSTLWLKISSEIWQPFAKMPKNAFHGNSSKTQQLKSFDIRRSTKWHDSRINGHLQNL